MSIPITSDGVVIVNIEPMFDTNHGVCLLSYRWEGGDDVKHVYVSCCHMAHLCRAEMSKRNENYDTARRYIKIHNKLETCCVIA